MTLATANALARQLHHEVCTIETYWDKPSGAIKHLNEILGNYGLQIAEFISWDDYQETYRRNFELNAVESGERVDNTWLCFSWYRMPSGRYEITCYLS